MTNANTLVDQYLAAWNETDGQRRRQIIDQTWSADGRYIDPMMSGDAPAAIDAMIAAAQARFPAFRFHLKGAVDAHGDNVRFSWGAGPAGSEAVVEGTDFAVIDGGRLACVTGFLDKVPG